MPESIKVWLKKVFSLTLMLNSFVTLSAIIGLTYGFYCAWPNWKPFEPYLISGNVFLLVIAAGLINIFPSASIGRKLHTGRFLFHHYVYGAAVLTTSSFCVLAFSSISIVGLFLLNTSNVAINAGRFFILTGATLLLDDLPDVSKRIEISLNKIKNGFYKIRKAIYVLQFLTGVATFYVFLSILLTEIKNWNLGLNNAFTMGTLLITSITSFMFFKRKEWLKITPGVRNTTQ
jgi:hypothetical protein